MNLATFGLTDPVTAKWENILSNLSATEQAAVWWVIVHRLMTGTWLDSEAVAHLATEPIDKGEWEWFLVSLWRTLSIGDLTSNRIIQAWKAWRDCDASNAVNDDGASVAATTDTSM